MYVLQNDFKSFRLLQGCLPVSSLGPVSRNRLSIASFIRISTRLRHQPTGPCEPHMFLPVPRGKGELYVFRVFRNYTVVVRMLASVLDLQ